MRKLPVESQKPMKEKSVKEKNLAPRAKSLLEAFEYIVELAEDSNLSDEFFEKAKIYVKYAVRKLKMSPMQIVLLALFIDRSEDRSIMMSELATYTGCRTTRFLRMADDIDVLENKRYIRASRSNNSVSYRVPSKVLQALRRGEPYIHEEDPVVDTSSFFDSFDRLMEERNDDEITHDALLNTIMDNLEAIKDTVFARNLRRTNIDNSSMLLFIYMAHLFVENKDDNINFHDIDDIYDDNEIPRTVKFGLRNRTHCLFLKGLIENAQEDGMGRSDAFKLTESAKEEFLAELDLQVAASADKALIKHDSLAPKTLIFNSEEERQISTLSSILSEHRFHEVQKRLHEAGMRPGFCCLFYGAPGTGKTETVYQLARATGRDIMRIDVDKIKSCWVGESEKNIKAAFDRYRKICKESSNVPILIFNEADAVLGVRMEGASKAVDKMENSIQNIILQEMETLEGIMIATTNLTSNLDKAFERRFLYKIRYEKPSVESRAEIWKTMLPGLSATQAHTLSCKFDLSGGEIENIVRKQSVNAILSGKEIIDLDALIETCRHERISSKQNARIGF